jgi:hypothetical protein
VKKKTPKAAEHPKTRVLCDKRRRLKPEMAPS